MHGYERERNPGKKTDNTLEKVGDKKDEKEL